MNSKRHSLAWQQLKEDIDRANATLNDHWLDLRTYQHQYSYQDKPTRLPVFEARAASNEIGMKLREIIDLIDAYDWRDIDEQET